MKKRLLLIILTFALMIGLISCGDGDVVETQGIGDTTEVQQITPEDVVLFGGDDDYRIVYSGNATNAVKDLIIQMTSEVKSIIGENPKRVGDNAKNEEEQPREILIASTNRAESSEGMAKIDGIGYRVEFIGEKLVITASNDNILRVAVEKLLDTWKTADGKIILNNTTVLEECMNDSMLSLYDEDAFRFRIVIQATASNEIHEAVQTLSGRISALVGKSVNIDYDGMIADTDGSYEICIGETNRQASKNLYSSLDNSYMYRVKIDGTKIVIGSMYNEALVSAISNFADDICAAISGCYCGTPAIMSDYLLEGSASNTLLKYPEPDVVKPKGISKTGENEYVFYYENVQQNDYEAYVESLRAEGCQIDETYTLGNNLYTLMEHQDFSVYVSYLAKVGAMRVILGKPDVLQPESASATESNVCKPALWQLEVDNKGSASNGGMSYVIQLTDGTFIVIDGGYNTNTEADNLYNLLKENTIGGGEPVISAWLITHLHVDHWGCLKNFSSKYSNKVQVKAFYYNFPGVGMGDITVSVKNNVEGFMKKFSGAKLYGNIHSGMNFSVVDAKITVMCTFEDVYPMAIEEGNDTTTVFRIDVGGTRIMFLGDAYYNESATMISQIDAAEFKSDLVQFSHHGYEGCSEGLYRMINAETVLWPMNIVGYQGGTVKNVFKSWYNSTLSANGYVRNNKNIKKIIVSGAGTEKLDLPYTPSGVRLPDYEAIFKERTENAS